VLSAREKCRSAEAAHSSPTHLTLDDPRRHHSWSTESHQRHIPERFALQWTVLRHRVGQSGSYLASRIFMWVKK
jgi:hypothetical protein